MFLIVVPDCLVCDGPGSVRFIFANIWPITWALVTQSHCKINTGEGRNLYISCIKCKEKTSAKRTFLESNV